MEEGPGRKIAAGAVEGCGHRMVRRKEGKGGMKEGVVVGLWG